MNEQINDTTATTTLDAAKAAANREALAKLEAEGKGEFVQAESDVQPTVH